MASKLNRQIAQAVRRQRMSMELTQAQVAKQAGVSLFTVHRLEAEKHVVKTKTLIKITDALEDLAYGHLLTKWLARQRPCKARISRTPTSLICTIQELETKNGKH